MSIYDENTFNRYLANFNKRGDVPSYNKKSISSFLRYLQAQGIGVNRRLKYLCNLTTISRLLGKPFNKCDEKDFERLILEAQKQYAHNTVQDFKIEVRKFISWLDGCPEKQYSPRVRWIHNLKHCRIARDRDGLFTKKDVETLCKHASARDQAMIWVLFDAGLRVDELLTLKTSDFFDENALAGVNVHGTKTENATRTIPFLYDETIKAVKAWLREHPKTSAFLWVTEKNKPIQYRIFRVHLHKIARRAGLTKKTNPHWLRHSAATRDANDARLTRSQLCYKFGWNQKSGAPDTYLHTNKTDLCNAIAVIRQQESGASNEFAELSDKLLAKALENSEELRRVIINAIAKQEGGERWKLLLHDAAKCNFKFTAAGERKTESYKKRQNKRKKRKISN